MPHLRLQIFFIGSLLDHIQLSRLKMRLFHFALLSLHFIHGNGLYLTIRDQLRRIIKTVSEGWTGLDLISPSVLARLSLLESSPFRVESQWDDYSTFGKENVFDDDGKEAEDDDDSGYDDDDDDGSVALGVGDALAALATVFAVHSAVVIFEETRQAHCLGFK